MNIFELKDQLDYLKKQIDRWEKANDFRDNASMIPVYNDEESYFVNIGYVDFSILKEFIIKQLKEKIAAIENVVTPVKLRNVEINYGKD